MCISAAETHWKLLDRACVDGASFWTWCGFKCDLEHRHSVAVLCMMYKITCNPMRPHYGALPLPCQCGLHVVLWAHIGILAHLLDIEPYSTAGLLILSVSLWNDLADPYSMVWNWLVSNVGPMLFYWPKLLAPFFVLYCFLFLFFLSIRWYGVAVIGLIWWKSLSPSLAFFK